MYTFRSVYVCHRIANIYWRWIFIQRILYCVKENLCGALVRQSIGLYLSDFLRLFTIHTTSELSIFNIQSQL